MTASRPHISPIGANQALQVRPEARVYVVDETRLSDWLRSSDLAQRGWLSGPGKDPTQVRASSALIDKHVHGGDPIQLTDPESLTPGGPWDVAVGQRRENGTRLCIAAFGLDSDLTFHERVGGLREWFDEMTTALRPLYARMTFGPSSSTLFDSRHCPEELVVPVTGYHWRNYLSPAISTAGLRLGDGTIVDEPLCLETGFGPIATLQVRDRLRRLLDPILPPRKPNRTARAGSLLEIHVAEVDGGIELPATLEHLVVQGP